MVSLMQRRREMMKIASAPVEILSDPQIVITEYGYKLISSSPYKESAPAECGITEYYDAQPGDSISLHIPSGINFGSGNTQRVLVYSSRYTVTDYWTAGQSNYTRTFTMRTATSGQGPGYHFKVSVDMRKESGYWCINNTTGKVYFAGKDTQYSGKSNIND